MVRQKAESNRQDSDEEGKKPKKVDVAPAQVAGAALASVTAAFLGSRLGVAGTVAGAGMTSVVITVGGALYQRSLENAKEKAVSAAAKASEKRLKRTSVARYVSKDRKVETTRRIHLAPGMHWPGGETVVDEDRTAKVDTEAATRKLHVAALDQATEVTDVKPEPDRRKRRVRWAMVAASCAAAFVLSMLIITGFEGVTGKPLSGGETGTTLGQVLQQKRQPTPSVPTEPAKPQETHSSKPQPSTEVTPTEEPTAQPTTENPAPTQQPTRAPATEQQPSQAPESGVFEQPTETGVLHQPTSGR
ncbi:hypothetical protein [Saccharopolyspora phatthalungensis]|uniref:Uncharacterized protein n=1 Tax=Saccharopolyspora phatthalungensis TaxID=664693 RepID=A0A840Q1L0_9PSEU|nr:hypothetical protein [Saccharopolyspora phatthalungensis]MBB5153887.1 hypothetical protein [Saccharopolyspora phatthalungensis]